MKIAVLLLSLWAIAGTKASPVVKPPVAPPVATAPAPPGPPAAPAAPAVPAPAGTTPTKTPAPVAPADLVSTKYKVSFKLANVKYVDGLTSYDSGVYQNYAGKIEKALMNLYADNDAYREMRMIGFRNETGVIADVALRFANDSKNLASLDALIKTGNLGGLPVDPASFQASKDESVPPVALMGGGYGCGQPCGAPQQCFPSCSSDCCGSSGGSFTSMMGGAPMPPMPMAGPQMPMMGPQMPMAGPQMPPMPFPPQMPMGGAGGQCSGQCPSSCAPSCQQSCCGGAGGAGQMNPPMLG